VARQAWRSSSGQGPGSVEVGEAVFEHGPQIQGGGPGAETGMVRLGAHMAQLDPAPVLGSDVSDGPLTLDRVG